jgi:hypothetical protein
LGATAARLSHARQSLIAEGVIYAPEHGLVAFTAPGMAPYIRRQHSAE